jgi:hypothetical protein
LKSDTESKAEGKEALETKAPKGPRYQVNLPGFITDEEIGLGEVIKRATSSIGIQPCGGCAERAARLNRWMVFRSRRHR